MAEVRVLSDGDVASVLDLEGLLPVVAEALRAQRAGAVERPERPHFPVGRRARASGGDSMDDSSDGGRTDGDGGDVTDDDRDEDTESGTARPEADGTALTMPAYVHGAEHYATKLVSVHEGNADREIDTVQAQIAVTEAHTGRPAAYLAGTRVTNARTGCVGGLCVGRLPAPVELGVIGAGRQARWQTRAIAAATDLSTVRIYSPSESRERCAADLRERGVDARAVESARKAVAGADAVVTATTATEPVFPGDALASETLVVAVGAYTPSMREVDATTVERARGRLFADVPEEAIEVGDLAAVGISEASLQPVADLFETTAWPPDPVKTGGTELQTDGTGDDEPGDVTLVESVGSAVMDACAAEHLLERARDAEAGRLVEL